jgi:hypothetical protein
MEYADRIMIEISLVIIFLPENKPPSNARDTGNFHEEDK